MNEVSLPAPVKAAQHVMEAVERTVALVQTWLARDRHPRASEGGDRIYTPHKVIHRKADRLIDHLVETDALLNRAITIPDHWHASLATLA